MRRYLRAVSGAAVGYGSFSLGCAAPQRWCSSLLLSSSGNSVPRRYSRRGAWRRGCSVPLAIILWGLAWVFEWETRDNANRFAPKTLRAIEERPNAPTDPKLRRRPGLYSTEPNRRRRDRITKSAAMRNVGSWHKAAFRMIRAAGQRFTAAV